MNSKTMSRGAMDDRDAGEVIPPAGSLLGDREREQGQADGGGRADGHDGRPSRPAAGDQPEPLGPTRKAAK